MSSDQLGSIQEPVVTVDFDISQDGQRKVESIELSREELARFVSSLEAANKVCYMPSSVCATSPFHSSHAGCDTTKGISVQCVVCVSIFCFQM